MIQGLDARASWERYCPVDGESPDAATVRATLGWIRAQLEATARRRRRHGLARLLAMDASRLAGAAQALPSLEAFAEEQGLADEPQSHQIAAYEAAHAQASRRLGRRARLIERQLEALHQLESEVAQAPRAADAVDGWLSASLAARLEAAGLATLGQLATRINGIGRRWHAAVPGLGDTKARRVEAWLRAVAEAPSADPALRLGSHLGLPRHRLYAHELNAVVAPATDVRPLEKFLLPPALDGSRGLLRRAPTPGALRAANDLEAILAWLASKRPLSDEQKAALQSRRRQRDSGVEVGLDWLRSLSHTQRAYRKEAERFLLWTVLVRGKAMSSIDPADCDAYRAFLADPQPRARWCGGRARERWSPLWRPFEGPLSPAAQRHAVTVLGAFYAFLVERQYLIGNPWKAAPVRAAARAVPPRPSAARSFDAAQWRYVERRLAALPDTSANRRLVFALPWLYATGLRLSEAVAATTDDLKSVSFTDRGGTRTGWLLRVTGRGGRVREVPVPAPLVDSLSRYLESRGLSPDLRDPTHGPTPGAARGPIHLLGQVREPAPGAPRRRTLLPPDPCAGIAAATLHDQVKAFFADCAAQLKAGGDEAGAAHFSAASTHWLRHSHARHALAAGMPVEVAQQNLGHASPASTAVYLEGLDAARRLGAAEAFWSAVRR